MDSGSGAGKTVMHVVILRLKNIITHGVLLLTNVQREYSVFSVASSVAFKK